MSKADAFAITAPRDSAAGSSVIRSIWALFSMTVNRQSRSIRLVVLALLYLLPVAFVILLRMNLGGDGAASPYSPDAVEAQLNSSWYALFPVALLPIAALAYGPGLIQDEVDEQTITYILIRPVPRWSIYAAKLLATLLVLSLLTAVYTAAMYAAIGWGYPDFWRDGALIRMAKVIPLFALTLASYLTLFNVFSLLLKKGGLLGVGYLLFSEVVLANLRFMTRKITVLFYYRALYQQWIKEGIDPIEADDLPTIGQALIVTGVKIAVFVAIACVYVQWKEFRVKSPEGN